MIKLLLSLGLIDLAFHHPLLTALTLVGAFLYQQSTKEERQQIKQLTMSIYSNGKLFTQYLKDKAKELDLKLPDLRKKVVIDLEIPEVEPANGFDSNEEFELFARDFSPEERQVFIENEFAREKVRRLMLDIVRQPEAIWVEDNLEGFCLDDEDIEEQKLRFKNWGVKVAWDKIFTSKDFRQLKTKLKALGKATDGSIVDEQLNQLALLTLERIENHFTDYQFTN